MDGPDITAQEFPRMTDSPNQRSATKLHPDRPNPLIIQGGMGVGVSGWNLARTVSQRGMLGVVSGTAVDTLVVRRLQQSDVGGHYRRALEAFPLRDMAEKFVETYFRAEPVERFKLLTLPQYPATPERDAMIMMGAFAEVYLAKEGHNGLVGINLLTKIQFPTLATLYGAMLAGVDYVLMGAGIPREVPGILDRYTTGGAATLKLDVEGIAGHETVDMVFDPRTHFPEPPALKRPKFLAIVSTHSLAGIMAKKSTGHVDGFVVEAPEAGGHNAPPRGKEVNARGEPQYGPRDYADLAAMREIGRPFWLAGNGSSPAVMKAALASGAEGLQVGTLFAFSDESGITTEIKRQVVELSMSGKAEVYTDPRISPTGFPFKVLEMAGTLSDDREFDARPKRCDLGYLRAAYRKEDGTIGFRCASEPDREFLKKGGDGCEIAGRKCLCNALSGTIGMAQANKDGYTEKPVVTTGDQVKKLAEFLPPGTTHYSANLVIDYLLKGAT